MYCFAHAVCVYGRNFSSNILETTEINWRMEDMVHKHTSTGSYL